MLKLPEYIEQNKTGWTLSEVKDFEVFIGHHLIFSLSRISCCWLFYHFTRNLRSGPLLSGISHPAPSWTVNGGKLKSDEMQL
jgi:hypothetical protein